MLAKKRASRRLLKSDLARVDAHVIKSHEYAELPEFGNVTRKSTFNRVDLLED